MLMSPYSMHIAQQHVEDLDQRVIPAIVRQQMVEELRRAERQAHAARRPRRGIAVRLGTAFVALGMRRQGSPPAAPAPHA